MKPTPPMAPGTTPVVGHLPQFRKDQRGFFEKSLKTIGPAFSIKLLNKRAAVLMGTEYHKIFFAETDTKLRMDKPYRFMREAFGEVGPLGPPEVNEKHWPALHGPFKSEKMPGYIKVMHLEMQQWLDGLGEEGEMELVGEIQQVVQNVASHALLGKEFHDRIGREFWDAYLTISRSIDPVWPTYLPLPKHIRRDRAKKKLESILLPIIAERRANPDKYNDLLQEIVKSTYKDGSPIDDETILGLIRVLMFAGQETTAGQAAWTLIQLLQNPDYLQTLRQEVDKLLPNHQTITPKILSSLEHVWWAVLETTRMHPAANTIIREAEEDVDIGDYYIPKGWLVLLSPDVAQRLPELFAEPENYDPLRFGPGREEDRQDRFAIIDFGGGIHKCAGINFANNEMMVITALLFQQFELELVTQDTHNVYNLGASRPSKTTVRYRRRKRSSDSSPDQAAQAAESACPHMKLTEEASQTSD